MSVWNRIRNDLDLAALCAFILASARRGIHAVKLVIGSLRWLRQYGMLGLGSIGIATAICVKLKVDGGQTVPFKLRLTMLAVFAILAVGNLATLPRNRADLGLLRERTRA